MTTWTDLPAMAKIEVVVDGDDLVAVGATVLQTTIDFRPVTFAAGVFYKF